MRIIDYRLGVPYARVYHERLCPRRLVVFALPVRSDNPVFADVAPEVVEEILLAINNTIIAGMASGRIGLKRTDLLSVIA